MSIFDDELEPESPETLLDDVEDAVDAVDAGVTLTVTVPPLGRSWGRDFVGNQFKPFGAGPIQTSGLDTLRMWIEKCLRTARGAHAVYSDKFGVEGPVDEIGMQLTELTSTELEEKVTEALTQHPRISDIDNFESFANPDDDYLLVNFDVVVLGEEGGLQIRDLELS
jgi:hypothetical protein